MGPRVVGDVDAKPNVAPDQVGSPFMAAKLPIGHQTVDAPHQKAGQKPLQQRLASAIEELPVLFSAVQSNGTESP